MKKNIFSPLALAIVLFTVHATSRTEPILPMRLTLQNIIKITQDKIYEWNKQHPELAVLCKKAPCYNSNYPVYIQSLGEIIRLLELNTPDSKEKARWLLKEVFPGAEII